MTVARSAALPGRFSQTRTTCSTLPLAVVLQPKGHVVQELKNEGGSGGENENGVLHGVG
jgi:hypothetical protein